MHFVSGALGESGGHLRVEEGAQPLVDGDLHGVAQVEQLDRRVVARVGGQDELAPAAEQVNDPTVLCPGGGGSEGLTQHFQSERRTTSVCMLEVWRLRRKNGKSQTGRLAVS